MTTLAWPGDDQVIDDDHDSKVEDDKKELDDKNCHAMPYQKLPNNRAGPKFREVRGVRLVSAKSPTLTFSPFFEAFPNSTFLFTRALSLSCMRSAASLIIQEDAAC